MTHTLWYNAERDTMLITTTFTDQLDFLERMWFQGFEIIGEL